MPNSSTPLRPNWSSIKQEEFRDLYKGLHSLDDLARFWGVPPYQLGYYAYRIDKRLAYKKLEIPRRNGKDRRIEAPNPTLKYLQRILHESLTRVYGPHPAVHGFLAEKSIVSNAENHLERRYVLTVDLEDFFPSITRRRVFGRLVSEPYSFDGIVANLIASLSTNHYGRLPQGSPASPVIANMVAANLDADLVKLCRPLGAWYTRYADDIAISTSRTELSPRLARYPNALGTGQVVIGDELTEIITRHGFRINHRKSRLQSYWTRQTCTGLVVNGKRPSPPRPYIRRLRSLVDHWQKSGWQDAAQILHAKEARPLFSSRQGLLNHVMGRISYLKMVRGQDDSVALQLERLVGSLPQDH